MFDLLPQLVVNSLITGSIYALASAGLALTFGILKILNFAHGHTMMVGAYVYFLFIVTLGVGMFPAAALTIAFMLILGFLCLNVFIKPFATSSLLPFVTTVALGAILEATIGMVFGVNVQAFSSSFASDSIEFMGVFITPLEILIIGSAIFILGIMAIVVHRTSLGRRIRAIAENPAAAEALGISRKKITTGAFLFSSLLAAYAGILVGYETSLQPTMGSGYSIKAFAAMILGGLGNVWGTVVGAYILGFVENLSVGLDFWGYSVPSGYKDAFAFVIILFVLLLRPQGLFGSKGRAA
jgi:branched-subunit amino acid ABC-type transport system permease component